MGNAQWGVDDGWSGQSAHAGFWTLCTNDGSGKSCKTTVTQDRFNQHGRYLLFRGSLYYQSRNFSWAGR